MGQLSDRWASRIALGLVVLALLACKRDDDATVSLQIQPVAGTPPRTSISMTVGKKKSALGVFNGTCKSEAFGSLYRIKCIHLDTGDDITIEQLGSMLNVSAVSWRHVPDRSGKSRLVRDPPKSLTSVPVKSEAKRAQ